MRDDEFRVCTWVEFSFFSLRVFSIFLSKWSLCCLSFVSVSGMKPKRLQTETFPPLLCCAVVCRFVRPLVDGKMVSGKIFTLFSFYVVASSRRVDSIRVTNDKRTTMTTTIDRPQKKKRKLSSFIIFSNKLKKH